MSHSRATNRASAITTDIYIKCSVTFIDKTLVLISMNSQKRVRAQLSTHEQALLLVNSLTPIGKPWWTNGLITDYRIVQNIPREFFDSATEIACEELFGPGYFEWEEARQRLSGF